MEDSQTSPSSKKILEKLEAVIEPNRSAEGVEEYKISILALTIAHGEKIILPILITKDEISEIKTLEEFQQYECNLKREPWYAFVEKTYIYGYAPFGNVCLTGSEPKEVWSRLNTKQGLEKITNKFKINTTNREIFVKGVNVINSNFLTEPIPDSSMPTPTSRYKDIPQKRGPIMARMYKTNLSYYTPEEVSKSVPVSGIMNPMKMRLEIIPSSYVLSGKNTDNIEKSIKEDPKLVFNAEGDRYSGIFVSILSDNRGNSFTFPSFLNLADGKHIIEIYQKLQKPIPGIDVNSANGDELYDVVLTYLNEWSTYANTNKFPRLLHIEHVQNTYYIPDKLTQKPKPVRYIMLTRLNTMNIFVLANLVFDFLLFKQTNPTTPYKKNKDELKLWIEELKTKNSKIINISTACESVNPYIMNDEIVQDVASYIKANSLHRTKTQIETEEEGLDFFPFTKLNNFIAQFDNMKTDYPPLMESLKQSFSNEFASPLKREIGGSDPEGKSNKFNKEQSSKHNREKYLKYKAKYFALKAKLGL